LLSITLLTAIKAMISMAPRPQQITGAVVLLSSLLLQTRYPTAHASLGCCHPLMPLLWKELLGGGQTLHTWKKQKYTNLCITSACRGCSLCKDHGEIWSNA